MQNMTQALENLMVAIHADYLQTFPIDRCKNDQQRETRERMQQEFRDSLSYTEGKKYIRITQKGSAWGFVVNIHDDPKFKYGDILKSASWAAPTRNHSRGNLFGGYNIQWTGPAYMR